MSDPERWAKMKTAAATFEVHSVFFLTGRKVTVLGGLIKSGLVKAGMKATVLVDSGLYMDTTIKSIESIRADLEKCNVGLILDTPEEETREFWKALCLPGDIIAIEE